MRSTPPRSAATASSSASSAGRVAGSRHPVRTSAPRSASPRPMPSCELAFASEQDAHHHSVLVPIAITPASPFRSSIHCGQSRSSVIDHCGSRLSRKAITPSRASGAPITCRCNRVSRSSTSSRVGGGSRHSSRLLIPTDTGATLTAMSLRDLERARQHLVGVERLVRQTPTFGVVAGELLAGEQDLGGAGVADDARQRPVAVRVGHDTATVLHDAELRLARHDAHVALQGDRQPQADRVTVDRGDDRLAHAATDAAAADLRRTCVFSLGAPNTAGPFEKSAPEQNARPAPVMTTTRTSSSASLRRIASSSSRPICPLNALRTSGRSSVMIATRSSTS